MCDALQGMMTTVYTAAPLAISHHATLRPDSEPPSCRSPEPQSVFKNYALLKIPRRFETYMFLVL